MGLHQQTQFDQMLELEAQFERADLFTSESIGVANDDYDSQQLFDLGALSEEIEP